MKRWIIVLSIVGSVVLTIILILLIAPMTVISVLYSRNGSFTVTVNKTDNINYGLALSESCTFETSSARINYNASEALTNIYKYTLPDDLDSDEGGEHNVTNYVAYTFFLKNTGKSTITYQYELYSANMTNGIHNALRVRLFINKDGEYGYYKDYAEAAANGEPEPETTPFLSETTFYAANVEDFQPGDVTRYTVVMWLEKSDPDLTDDALGGIVKLNMNFSVLSAG